MKRFSDFRPLQEASERPMPMTILLRRDTYRTFPGGQRVGIYKNDEYRLTVSIPFAANGMAMSISEQRQVMPHVEKSFNDNVVVGMKTDRGSYDVHPNIAKAIVDLDSVLTKENQKVVRQMIRNGPKSYERLARFARDLEKKKENSPESST